MHTHSHYVLHTRTVVLRSSVEEAFQALVKVATGSVQKFVDRRTPTAPAESRSSIRASRTTAIAYEPRSVKLAELATSRAQPT